MAVLCNLIFNVRPGAYMSNVETFFGFASGNTISQLFRISNSSTNAMKL